MQAVAANNAFVQESAAAELGNGQHGAVSHSYCLPSWMSRVRVSSPAPHLTLEPYVPRSSDGPATQHRRHWW